MRALDAAVLILEADDRVGQARKPEFFKLVAKCLPGGEDVIKIDAEGTADFPVEHDPWFVQPKYLRVGRGHDVLRSAALKAGTPRRGMDDPAQNMAFGGTETCFPKRRAHASADFPAVENEALGKALLDQLTTPKGAVDEDPALVDQRRAGTPGITPPRHDIAKPLSLAPSRLEIAN